MPKTEKRDADNVDIALNAYFFEPMITLAPYQIKFKVTGFPSGTFSASQRTYFSQLGSKLADLTSLTNLPQTSSGRVARKDDLPPQRPILPAWFIAI